jgi:hypothetical protein
LISKRLARRGIAAGDARHVDSEEVSSVLRERLYGAISCLATLAVLVRYTDGDTHAWARVLDVAVTTGGLWSASLLADWVAYLVAYQHGPRGGAAVKILRSSGQIFQVALAPALVLASAAFGWLDTHTAVWVAMWTLIAELGLVVMLAVRGTGLSWWQKLLASLALVGVGAVVVGIKMIAH